MTNSSPLLIESLRVMRKGRAILSGLDLEVPAAAVIGLLGPSGSGKTTLMRSIVGVQRVESGSVRVLGLPAGSPAVRRQVGYSTQSPAVYQDLTVRENLSYFARVKGCSASEVEKVAGLVGLESHLARLVAELSGGEVSRVSLAVAMLGDNKLLVLDEPTVGLDPILRSQLWDLFQAMAQHGVTLVISSHVMDEAARCDQLLLMRDGDLLATGTPTDLMSRTGAETIEQAFIALVRDQDRGQAPAHEVEKATE